MDGLFNEFSKSNIGGVFAGGFGYADDLKFLTPSVHALRILTTFVKSMLLNMI